MTVKELIAELQQFDGDVVVVVDLHSEFAEARSAEKIVAYDNGGYISYPYREEDRVKSKDMVRIA